MTDQTTNATPLTPAEIEYSCQTMLTINGAVALSSTPDRQPQVLAEIAAWLLSAAMFLALRDSYKAPQQHQLSDSEIDAAIERLKFQVPARADILLGSINLACSPPPSAQQGSTAAH